MWVRFMAFLATIIFICAGGLILLTFEGNIITLVDIFSFVEKTYTDANTRFIVVSVGLGLIALGLFNVYLGAIVLRRRPFVVIRDPKGDIQIAYGAIEGLVEKAGKSIGGIDRISTRIIPGRKISLQIRLFLGSGKNARDISNRVQEFVKDEIENVLGIKNLGPVKVLIKRVAMRKEKQENILEQGRTSRGIELRH